MADSCPLASRDAISAAVSTAPIRLMPAPAPMQPAGPTIAQLVSRSARAAWAGRRRAFPGSPRSRRGRGGALRPLAADEDFARLGIGQDRAAVGVLGGVARRSGSGPALGPRPRQALRGEEGPASIAAPCPARGCGAMNTGALRASKRLDVVPVEAPDRLEHAEFLLQRRVAERRPVDRRPRRMGVGQAVEQIATRVRRPRR